MRFSRLLGVAFLLASTGGALSAQTPSYQNVGRAPTKQEIEAVTISIGPDGKNLPPGKGTAKEGAPIFVAKCAVCHGLNAEGGKIGPQLAAGKPEYDTLTTLKPIRVVGDYWPYATMVWDYIRRAMPRNQAGTLTPNEVYALTAFILYKSGIVQEGDVLDQKTLPKVQMPNRNGFVPAKFEDIPDEHKRGCTQGVCP
jgi:S-disulfanyl-L-cysteine oxidoreductase SoxD